MSGNSKQPVLVVVQLTGGNDYLNTVIPYNDPLYWDNRHGVGVPEDQILRLDDQVGFHPEMSPIKDIYDKGNMAIIHGIGYANSPRSHFRSMDIWHTCEVDKMGTEGWLGLTTRDMDPNKENVLTAVSFGPGLFRALTLPGVPMAAVDDLDSYGLFTDISSEQQRAGILDRFARMYSPVMGSGAVMDYLGQTGLDTLKGADILSEAPKKYFSTVEYPDTPISKNLKGIAQVHLADLGTRVLYCDQGSYDTHCDQVRTHNKLWKELSEGIDCFFADLEEHNAADNMVMFVFSEFGRRVLDNGSGTDHGSGGMAFVIGNSVKGGMYGEYPSLEPEDQLDGDLHFNNDFRQTYTSLLEQWMGLEAAPIVNGHFEPFDLFKN